MRSDLGSALLLLLSACGQSDSTSPPEKPVLISCRSPEKETFTCWWEPGSDGGLPTTHRLYYERERLEGIHECPDYRSAGRNSCFFDKSHTSIWVDYYLTVVAANALGNATSDPFKIDVMEIVKPNAPENLTLLVKESENSPYLHIQWERPSNTDTKSGWVTIKYEMRVRRDDDGKWKEYLSGTQTNFYLYSVIPGVMYMVQVRCMLDHGSWSEWTNTTSVQVPNYPPREKSLWILVCTVALIPLSAAVCVFVVKRKYVKQWVLPPVPAPKIKGVDFQLLKNGRCEEALIIHPHFHVMAWKDQMEEYLIVTENDNRLPQDPSHFHKRKKSSLGPACFHLQLAIQCKNSTNLQDECEKATERKYETDEFVEKSLSGERSSNAEPAHLLREQHCTCVNFVNAGAPEESQANRENAVRLFTNGSYVDVRTHVENLQMEKQVDDSGANHLNGSGYRDVQTQDVTASGDYSRVKEVDNDSKVFLQKHKVDPCREKGDHYKDCALQKPAAGAFELRTVLGGGYVDYTSELC
ncbi:prolactin receptor b [Brachionichthys hirsutus]|uniref:prolactin receptor b n=1 Tax=Brachionichthys hirsutus TaxID=412623 RepID=UPI0036049249